MVHLTRKLLSGITLSGITNAQRDRRREWDAELLV